MYTRKKGTCAIRYPCPVILRRKNGLVLVGGESRTILNVITSMMVTVLLVPAVAMKNSPQNRLYMRGNFFNARSFGHNKIDDSCGNIDPLSHPVEWPLDGSQAWDPYYWKESTHFYLTPSLARLMSVGRLSKTIQESVWIPEAVSSNNDPGKEIGERKISEVRLISFVKNRRKAPSDF
ncbi:hypothetical protein ARMGADRAFT_1035038 [Armillaria gallica]|uniref:Uncharacterized protein n=1 Tax=Armillaria gallica TaxID=47427 RepID=A0A2H3D8J5_ARMGA|nr:hypothetical protein ARMGADRAFT_1035038 [Armillaria gallica]